MNRLLAGGAAILAAGTLIGVAQSASTPPMLGKNGKPLKFDVVSIRVDKSILDPVKNPMEFGPTSDGYHLKGLSLIFAILAAYIPSQGGDSIVFNAKQIKGLPDWLLDTRYDINAKVSTDDLPKWKDPVLQRPMLRAMLQAMLAERFKLTLHRDKEDEPIYKLMLAKGGPKFKPSEQLALADIQKKYPAVHPDIGGAVVAGTPDQMTYFGVTMPTFCSLMKFMAGRPIEDETGLMGKYDITFRPLPPPQMGVSVDISPDISSVMDQLGLKLVSAKGPVEILVIDHIERPSEN